MLSLSERHVSRDFILISLRLKSPLSTVYSRHSLSPHCNSISLPPVGTTACLLPKRLLKKRIVFEMELVSPRWMTQTFPQPPETVAARPLQWLVWLAAYLLQLCSFNWKRRRWCLLPQDVLQIINSWARFSGSHLALILALGSRARWNSGSSRPAWSS